MIGSPPMKQTRSSSIKAFWVP